ncbi:MAG: M28 family peptidase [Candidatus Heimdallarchaeaceae archaeon]
MAIDLYQLDSKKVFNIVKHICRKIGTRVSGTEKEEEVAKYIAKHFETINSQKTSLKTYPHKYYIGTEASLHHIDTGTTITGSPIWMTKSTSLDGGEGEGVYLGSINQLEEIALDTIKDKIVFIFFLRDYLEPEIFGNLKKLYKLKPKGVVLLSNYNSEVTRSDPIFKDNSIFSQIPTMVIPASKFANLGDIQFSGQFRLSVKGKNQEGLLHNVVYLQDGEITDTILICAYHDTVENSTGAISNATGIALVLEIARILSKIETKFSYVFATFGGEEQNLEGAKHFLEDYFRSKIVLSINLDSIEPFPGFVASIVAGNKELFDIIKDTSSTNNFPALAVNSTPNEGANMIFAQEGIPSIMVLFKGALVPGINRTELDNLKLVSEKSLKETGEYVLRLVQKIESFEDLSFAEGIPPNLEKETENYFERLQFYQDE